MKNKMENILAIIEDMPCHLSICLNAYIYEENVYNLCIIIIDEIYDVVNNIDRGIGANIHTLLCHHLKNLSQINLKK